MNPSLSNTSVATLVLILGKSPYKDQNGKNGPYLVLILDFSPKFAEVEGLMTNLIKLLVYQRRRMYISLLKLNSHYFWVGPFNFNCILKFAFKIMVIGKCCENKNRSFIFVIFGPYLDQTIMRTWSGNTGDQVTITKTWPYVQLIDKMQLFSLTYAEHWSCFTHHTACATYHHKLWLIY